MILSLLRQGLFLRKKKEDKDIIKKEPLILVESSLSLSLSLS